VVGHDHRGTPLASGDRVRVLKGHVISPSTPVAAALAREDHAFTIVHAGSTMINFAYLDAGRSVGLKGPRDTAGLECVPAQLREDPRWWERLCFAEFRFLEKIGATNVAAAWG